MAQRLDDTVSGEKRDFTIAYEKILEGYRIWRDKHFLMGIFKTRHFQGLTRNGTHIYEVMPPEAHAIHWTSPDIPVEQLREIVRTLPVDKNDA